MTRIIFAFCLFFCLNRMEAQLSFGGTPQSWMLADSSAAAENPLILPPLDVARAQEADRQTPGQHRFAAPIFAEVDLPSMGSWSILPNGDRLWRGVVQSEGALGLVLLFDRFYLPPESRFFAYSADRRQVYGAFSAESCHPDGWFTLGPIRGEKVFLEYVEPAGTSAQAQMHLFRADYVFKQDASQGVNSPLSGFNMSLPCEVNVNCPPGLDWQTEKKGIARILMVFSNGSGWCSGTLVANTRETYEPLLLTAHHCQLIGNNPNFNLWRFDFDYESSDCSNPSTEPQPKSVLGCQRLAFRAETDFMLLKISEIPNSYPVYFNGWTRTSSAATKAVFIHHPAGDIKKISVDTQAVEVHPTLINWGSPFGTSPANSHWRSVPDIGIFEPGSSGSPLFDASKRLVGQLHGGNTGANGCIVVNTFWGRFDLSWSQGSTAQARLKDWLDPDNLNSLAIPGYTRPIPGTLTISGTVKAWWGPPIPRAKVQIEIGPAMGPYTLTDSTGFFIFNNLAAGKNYTLTCKRDTHSLNGLSTYDLLLTSRHILGLTPLDSPWKIIAADVNKSQSVTTFDIVESRKLLLGIHVAYPSSPSWRFYPADLQFTDPAQPFSYPLPESITLNNLLTHYHQAHFLGVKVGDVNVSANPNE